ncbi:MAG: ytrB [Caulobacteraceae bacterium]|nr:ytrB [Caulobacteraceae bacterium]
MNAVETKDLARRFRRTRAVDGIDLIVPKGATVVLVGANGAGKSTTLQMLMGLIDPSAGEARVLGKDCRRLEAADFRRIGYASENQVVPDYMKVEAWFDYLRPLYPSWDVGLERELRRRFDLPAHRLKSMSRGERMKACAAAALAFRPELLVMDEPLSGLDPLSRDELVRALIDQAGESSMLISSHDLTEIERVATHVALMHKGRLVLQEETDRLTSRFREVSVAIEGQGEIANLAASWINPRRAPGLFSFVETAFGGEGPLGVEVAGRLGVQVKPIVAPMSLAAISGAFMRDAIGHNPQKDAA